MPRATFTIGAEPKLDTSKLTKDRNAEPLELEFVCGKTTQDIRDGIEAHKARQNQRERLARGEAA